MIIISMIIVIKGLIIAIATLIIINGVVNYSYG